MTLRSVRAFNSTTVERRGNMKLLHYLMDAGISEADLERRAREVRLPIDLRDYIKKANHCLSIAFSAVRR
jgi:hypothetical protein